MRKTLLFMIVSVFLCTGAAVALDDIDIGRVAIPKAFIHEGKEYAKGIYHVILTEKDGSALFLVKSVQDELLFDDLAVVKPYEGKSKGFKHRIHKEMLKGYEYYRIKVTTPESLYMAYFLLKKDSAEPLPETTDQSSPSS